jgi:salicylate hydroxylase
MQVSELTVAVIGGGIGGMAAACALAQRGAAVTLYEQAPALREVGAGLQISANGQRVLRALGIVGAGVPDCATASAGTQFRDGAAGRFVARVPPPSAGATWYLHRADLLALLTRGAREAGVILRLGERVSRQGIEADLVVAADGARSGLRDEVDGAVQPQFTGQVAWRAVVPWDRRDAETHAVLSMGRGAHVVSYPLRGGKVMNLVAVEERTDWTQERWSQEGDPAEMQARFAQFGGVVGEIMAAASVVHTWALHARPVAQDWHRGNMVLVGDAAHPTLPFMAQGACMALEDAWVLADALAAGDDLAQALSLYRDTRHDRATRIVALATGNAWRFHMAKPLAWGAQAVLALGARPLAAKLEWVYCYDATRAIAN